MRSRVLSVAGIASGAAVGVVLALSPAVPAAPAPVHAHFWDVTPYGAPTNAKGGIGGPQVDCSDGSEAVVDWTVTNLSTEETKDLHFVGYDVPLLRVGVAHYRSRTVATCGEVTDTRTERVVVWQKTARTTISKSEFDRLRTGMTRAEVARIVGYGGTAGPSYASFDVQLYDKMPFGYQAQIDYRHDRIHDLYWIPGIGG